MDAANAKENATRPPDLCTVVVVYDDNATRTQALTACDYLVSQLWESVEMDFHWWRTDFLSDPYMAEAAAQHAVVSDFLIVCSGVAGQISATVENWLASWIDRRQNQEGALIDLAVAQSPGQAMRHRQDVLGEVAARGGFDYLTAAPQEQPATDRLKSTASPSVTLLPSAWKGPSDRSRPPSHYGLND